MSTLDVTVDGVEYQVEGTYYKAERGRTEGGVPMEPDEPAEFEIATIKIAGEPVEVDDETFDKVQSNIYKIIG